MSGFKKWATSDVLTAADLNAYCSFQSVMVFASTTARDSAIASGDRKDGMVCYIASNNSSEGLYTYNGTSWRKGPGWNAPWGVVDWINYTTNTTTAAANTFIEIGGGTNRLNITSVTGRLYKLTFNCEFENTDNAFQDVDVEIRNGTGSFRDCPRVTLPAHSGFEYPKVSYTTQWIGTLTAGSQALNIQFKSSNAGVKTNANTQPATLILEDIGASGTPT